LFSNLVPINCCTKICWLTILFSIYSVLNPKCFLLYSFR
jgi:hypothetical protein